MDFGVTNIAAITVICYLIGIGAKATKPLNDRTIPVICGAAGGALGIIAMITKMPDFPAHDPITAVAIGIVSGLAATGVNQIYKQATREG